MDAASTSAYSVPSSDTPQPRIFPILSNQQMTRREAHKVLRFTSGAGPPAPTPSRFLPMVCSRILGISQLARRPNPLRLPTLDAWNVSLQQSLTPDALLHDRLRGQQRHPHSWRRERQYDNPNEAAINLPAQYSMTGQALHYDPSVSSTTIFPGVFALNGNQYGISPSGGTNNQTYLRRYYGGKLPACADANYRVTDPLIGPWSVRLDQRHHRSTAMTSTPTYNAFRPRSPRRSPTVCR